MDQFQLVSNFTPAGDQPKAIDALVRGVLAGDKRQTLLGVTGSGKTFTMANVIQKLNRPTLILSPNKVLAAQLYGEFKQFFPHNAVEYFISYYDYYQPEAYIPQTDTYIEKDSAVNEQIDKLRLKATTSLLMRRDVIVVASVSCIYNIGSPDSFNEMRIYVKKGAEMTRGQLSGHLIKIQYQRDEMEFSAGKFRMRGPFVDVMNTMLDPSLPLTVGEYEEWGCPEEKEYFDYILSYSPYDNIEKKAYPNMLVTAGLNDPRVSYWEPAKYVAKLRAMKTDNNMLLLKTNMSAGHMGASGRYDFLKEIAFEYAFIFKVLGTQYSLAVK